MSPTLENSSVTHTHLPYDLTISHLRCLLKRSENMSVHRLVHDYIVFIHNSQKLKTILTSM